MQKITKFPAPSLPEGAVLAQTKVHLVNAKAFSKRNMHRIRGRKLEPCTNVISTKFPQDGSYFETYVVKYDAAWSKDGKKRFRFEEVNHGMGICGCFDSLRGLIIHSSRYVVIYLEPETAAVAERRAA